MTIGSLFTGIGGFDFGLELAGIGPVVWQVETDRDCNRVLARHWPGAERLGDIRECHSKKRKEAQRELGQVDIICLGFP